MSARALMIAAPASGAGKTVITAGLLRAFRRRGFGVRAAKFGPDYIDPAFHAAAAGADCVNLDTWAMGRRCSTRSSPISPRMPTSSLGRVGDGPLRRRARPRAAPRRRRRPCRALSRSR